MESQLISNIVDEAICYNDQNEMPDWYGIPSDRDQVGIHLSSINTTFYPITFDQSLSNLEAQSKFGMSIGSTTTHIVFTDVGALFEKTTIVEVLAVHAERTKGVKPVDLAKIRRIDVDTACRTLEITTQLKQ